MPVRLTLRSNKDFSPFRELLTWLIEAPIGDSIILCSGYIWEPETGYRILDDQLLDTIKRGCSQGEVTTIGGKFEQEMWLEYYNNFVDRLVAAGLIVKPYIAPRHNWHAKIAIRLEKNVPIAAIVGSSNLTGPACRKDWSRWNFEGDVLIWKNDPILDSHFRRPFNPSPKFGDMQLIFDPRAEQPNEQEQLNALHVDVLHGGLEKFVPKQ